MPACVSVWVHVCVFMYVYACIHVCVGVGGGGGEVSRSSSNRKSSIRTTTMKSSTLITFQTSRNSHVKAFATAWNLIITLAPAFSCKSKTNTKRTQTNLWIHTRIWQHRDWWTFPLGGLVVLVHYHGDRPPPCGHCKHSSQWLACLHKCHTRWSCRHYTIIFTLEKSW